MTPPTSRAAAVALDERDELAWLRDEFLLPEAVVYLDGNSLGALPKATVARLDELVRREWGSSLIRGWNAHGWMDLPRKVGDAIAPLIGARAGEVIVTDSTSVNLFKLLSAGLRLAPGRRVILSETDNFPTDLYIAQGLADLLGDGVELRLVERRRLIAALGPDVAVLLLTHVDFRTGALHDIEALTAAAHAAGALVLWDLSHSAGALEVDLDGCGADLAVGCGYKYLNGGPGAPAFAYVAARHQRSLQQPLWGWLGHASPFDLETAYRPAAGIARLACGSPPILGLAALEQGVALIARATVPALRRKSIALVESLIAGIERRCAAFAVALASPRDPGERGSQASFRHPHAYAVVQALIAEGVIGDFRAPDLMRFGVAPAYLRFADIWDAVEALHRVLAERRWDRPEYRTRARVT